GRRLPASCRAHPRLPAAWHLGDLAARPASPRRRWRACTLPTVSGAPDHSRSLRRDPGTSGVQPSRGSFLPQLFEVLVIQIVCSLYHLVVPVLPASGLVTADEQDRRTERVEREQHADIPSARTQFLHVRMARAPYRMI